MYGDDRSLSQHNVKHAPHDVSDELRFEVLSEYPYGKFRFPNARFKL